MFFYEESVDNIVFLALRRIKTHACCPPPSPIKNVTLKFWCRVWPNDLTWCDDRGISCGISAFASYRDKHNDISHTVLTLFCRELLRWTFSWPVMTSYGITPYDLFMGSLAISCTYPLPNRIWIVTLRNRYKWCWKKQENFGLRFTTGSIALTESWRAL